MAANNNPTEPQPTQEELIEFFIDGARYGDMEDITTALSMKVPVDGKDGIGRTALHMACANGHEDVVKALLAAGASVDVTNAEGNTPLHWACLNGHVGVVKMLMEKNPHAASALNNASRTPVDEALTRDNRAVMDVINAFNAAGSVQTEVVEQGEGEEGEGEGQGEGEEEQVEIRLQAGDSQGQQGDAGSALADAMGGASLGEAAGDMAVDNS